MHIWHQKLPDYSRSFLQKNIKSKAVLINGKAAKASYKVMGQDQIVFEAPEPVEPEIVPENIPLDILYEDDDVIVINKPKQMVVHPAPGHYTGTIVNALMYHCKDSLFRDQWRYASGNRASYRSGHNRRDRCLQKRLCTSVHCRAA